MSAATAVTDLAVVVRVTPDDLRRRVETDAELARLRALGVSCGLGCLCGPPR